MSTDFAALALVVDRSGSMQPIANDVKGGVKQFVDEQKKLPGKACMRVAQFDHTYEVIDDFKDIQLVDADAFTQQYCPRGSTALLDAIGRTTLELQKKIDEMTVEERPNRVVVAIITDGAENSSREFTKEKIKQLVKEKEAQGWDFVFMGATLDTIEVAQAYGFSGNKTAVFSTTNMESCMAVIGEKIRKARQGEEVTITQQERDDLVR